MTVRVAAYYAPYPSDPLWKAGCAWLGRDPETGARVPQPDVPGIAGLTQEPALYGFHATLKPPVRLRTSYAAFLEEAEALAASIPAFDLPPLRVADISGFLALRETEPCPALQALADACVEKLDGHRAPAGPDELARRRAGGRLNAQQEEMLVRWGYPYVFDTWFFHMTLTRRLSPEERTVVLPAAEAFFASALAQPRRAEAVTVFTQAGAGAPFLVAERLPLRG